MLTNDIETVYSYSCTIMCNLGQVHHSCVFKVAEICDQLTYKRPTTGCYLVCLVLQNGASIIITKPTYAYPTLVVPVK